MLNPTGMLRQVLVHCEKQQFHIHQNHLRNSSFIALAAFSNPSDRLNAFSKLISGRTAPNEAGDNMFTTGYA